MIEPSHWSLLEEAFELRVSEEERHACATWLSVLTRWSKGMNLMRWRSEGEFVERHFMEGMWMADRFLGGASGAADIGSGGGAPAIPVKVRQGTLRLELLESNGRKCAFLREVRRSLGLAGLEVHETRAEQWQGWGSCEVAMMRGLKASPSLWTTLREDVVPIILLHGEDASWPSDVRVAKRERIPLSERRWASLLTWV